MSERRGRPRDTAARRRILVAAERQLVSDGYATMTMSGMATEAGVAVQTLYLAYGSKVGVVSAVHDRTLAGDDAPVPLLERDWMARLAGMPTVDEAWALVMTHLSSTTVRVAPVHTAIQAASADPEVGALLTDLRAQRHEFSRELAARLLTLPGARGAQVTDRVVDVIYALVGPETHDLFVTQRGWSVEEWRRWVHDAVLDELTATRGRAAPRP